MGTKVLVITFFFLYFPSLPLGKSAIASTKKKKKKKNGEKRNKKSTATTAKDQEKRIKEEVIGRGNEDLGSAPYTINKG